MFAFSQAKPYTGSIRSKVNIPTGEYLSAAFEQGVHDSMFNSIMNMTELDLEREGRVMTADEANKQYGLGTLKFEQDVHESVARTLNERKAAEMRRQYYLSQGNPGGLFSGRGLAGVGAGFVGSILNPLDFSVNFLPVVGSEAAAARLASRGAGPVRQTLARGLVTTEEALARSIPVAPRLTSALIQGAVGNVVAEVPHLISALESQEDYTFADSVVNVAAGTVLGGALHLAMTAAERAFNRLSAGTRETMLRQAIDQFVKGEDVRVEKYIEIDPNVIRERVRFDEASARLKAIEELPDDLKQGELVGHRIVVTVDPVELGLDRGKIEVLITKNTIPGEAEYRITLVENNNPISHIDVTEKTARYIATKKPDAKFLLTLPAASNNGSLLHPDDLTGDQARRNRPDILEWGEPIFKESAQKETNLKALLESERAAWDEEGRFRKEMRAEIDRQIAEGRTLSPEQLKEWGGIIAPDKMEATLKEQSAQLKKDLDELMEEIGQVQEPAAKQELEAIAERTKKNLSAIEQAIACVIANPS